MFACVFLNCIYVMCCLAGVINDDDDDIKDCLQALDGAAFLSMADVSNGFYQVPLHEDDRDKTIFITRRRETAYVDSQTSFCPTTNW